jgi:hypothetical protein
MAAKNSNFPWQDKICNRAQIGGIETSLLDNGLGKSTRIAWVNTGTGLRYKIVIDRGLDIADAFFNQYSLVWLGHCGVTAPKQDANHGLEWLYSFGGGLLATCGLTHIGGPESGNGEERGLHGRIGNIPAELESVIQPDPAVGKLDMSITAVIKESRLFGTNYELRRTISSRLGEASIRIHDEVTNRASITVPHMMLYHCNFGWPLVDEGTDIVWKGKAESFGRDIDGVLFNDRHNYKKCQKPMEAHRASESLGIIDVTPDSKGICTAGLVNRKLNLAVFLKYSKKQLPYLSNWQHWGFGDYVTGIEPGTNPPYGQNKARENKTLIEIAPRKSRTYDLEICVLNEKNLINELVKTCG